MAPCKYFVVLLALVPTVFCCGGMNVVLEEVNTKCEDGSTSVFQISDDFGFTVNDKCVVSPTGCVEMTKEVNSAMLKYSVMTPMFPKFEGSHDGCELMKTAAQDKEATTLLTMFQFPTSCPVKAEKVCADGKTIDLSPHSGKMMFTSGRIQGKAVAEHKEGGKSCINFVLNISGKPL